MSLGYLSAIGAVDVSQVKAFQAALRVLAVNRNWPAVDPGRVDGILDSKTGVALVTVITAAPGIPDSVKLVFRLAMASVSLSSKFIDEINKLIAASASYITKAIQALTLVATLRSPGGAAPPPPAPPPTSSPTGSGSTGFLTDEKKPLSLGVKIGGAAAAVVALALVLK